jgi:hypothetical protein
MIRVLPCPSVSHHNKHCLIFVVVLQPCVGYVRRRLTTMAKQNKFPTPPTQELALHVRSMVASKSLPSAMVSKASQKLTSGGAHFPR